MSTYQHKSFAAAISAFVVALVFSSVEVHAYPNDRSGISCVSHDDSSKVVYSVKGSTLAANAVAQVNPSPASHSCALDEKFSSIREGGKLYRGVKWGIGVFEDVDIWIKGKDTYICNFQYKDSDNHSAGCLPAPVTEDRDFNGPIVIYK